MMTARVPHNRETANRADTPSLAAKGTKQVGAQFETVRYDRGIRLRRATPNPSRIAQFDVADTGFHVALDLHADPFKH